MIDSLQRFRDAQASGEYDRALREITEGEKRSHWIWYVFPQWKGLGHSSLARRYSIESRDEAERYVLDAVLGARLAAITAALAVHCGDDGRALDEVVGDVDALKVISCMTLFLWVIARLPAPRPAWIASFEKSATTIVDAAESRGQPRCARTIRALEDEAR